MKIEKRILYLKAGKTEPETLIERVQERIAEGEIGKVVIASTQGPVAIKFAETIGREIQILSITEFTYSDDIKKNMKKLNIIPVEKVELPLQDRLDMSVGLLFFGSGMKAALEVSVIAYEKGLISEKIIALGGGAKGLDTAIVVRPSGPEDFTNPDPDKRMTVLEILSLPYNE